MFFECTSFRIFSVSGIFEPPHDKTNKMVCAPSKDSDQPGQEQERTVQFNSLPVLNIYQYFAQYATSNDNY